ncbi:MAG: hypothetical protein EAZ07_04810 [Cytophagales bacterium]|nr:MAG: hypothetical protein EAZ07_04810 [Cytophagales bacterium]
MSLIIEVKINAVNNLSDARYCAGMGVNMLGFCVDPNSDSQIDLKKINAIIQWVSGVSIVFEFDTVNQEIFDIVSQEIQPDYIEVCTIENWESIIGLGVSVIHRIDALQNKSYKETAKDSPASYLLIEGLNENEILVQAEFFNRLSESKKILLAGNINAQNIERIIEIAKPWGIAITGGEEEKPGYKTFDEMADLLEKLEQEA